MGRATAISRSTTTFIGGVIWFKKTKTSLSLAFGIYSFLHRALLAAVRCCLFLLHIHTCMGSGLTYILDLVLLKSLLFFRHRALFLFSLFSLSSLSLLSPPFNFFVVRTVDLRSPFFQCMAMNEKKLYHNANAFFSPPLLLLLLLSAQLQDQATQHKPSPHIYRIDCLFSPHFFVVVMTFACMHDLAYDRYET